jgi:hypothetical protein
LFFKKQQQQHLIQYVLVFIEFRNTPLYFFFKNAILILKIFSLISNLLVDKKEFALRFCFLILDTASEETFKILNQFSLYFLG